MAITKLGTVTIGADPELFLRHRIGKGQIISAVGKIGGTKKNPLPIPDLGEGFGMQEDNVMVEFNIPPASAALQFSNSLVMAMRNIDAVIPQDTELIVQSSHVFKARQLRNKQSTVFGCEPDYNAWTERPNRFIPASNPYLRTCGGHVHIGLPDTVTDVKDKLHIIRACDVMLGVPSILIDRDKRRRELYGKAGAFRYKSYGVEYRTLSNFWLATPALREWVFDAAVAAVDKAATEADKINEWGDRIVKAINEQDEKLAERVCMEFNVEIP